MGRRASPLTFRLCPSREPPSLHCSSQPALPTFRPCATLRQALTPSTALLHRMHPSPHAPTRLWPPAPGPATSHLLPPQASPPPSDWLLLSLHSQRAPPGRALVNQAWVAARSDRESQCFSKGTWQEIMGRKGEGRKQQCRKIGVRIGQVGWELGRAAEHAIAAKLSATRTAASGGRTASSGQGMQQREARGAGEGPCQAVLQSDPNTEI